MKECKHKRAKIISYEKEYVPPTYEEKGNSIVVTGWAFYRYYVVWACEKCGHVKWVEDLPSKHEATDSSAPKL